MTQVSEYHKMLKTPASGIASEYNLLRGDFKYAVQKRQLRKRRRFMKYKKEERLVIGRRIYEGELTLATAAIKYDINLYTARDYLRLYKASENLSAPRRYFAGGSRAALTSEDINKHEHLTREELIDELLKAKAEASLLRKRLREERGWLLKQGHMPYSSATV